MKKSFKMDNIGYTNAHYKNIYNISSVIMLFLLQAYVMFLTNGIDCFNFNFIQNVTARIVLQLFIQFGVFSLSYMFIYFMVKKVYMRIWIFNHKNIWLKGTWLHIHVKKTDDEIRVGFVDISQNFYTIKASGTNLYPEYDGCPEQRETSWDYVLGKIFQDDYKRDFIGVYEAADVFEHIPRNGIHSLKIELGGNGYPNLMVGKFGDTVELDSQNPRGGSDSGQLYLFKPSDRCRKYFELGNRNELIYDLHNIDGYSDEQYVCKLKSIINDVYGVKK